jgi:hypothetical protein
MSAKTVHLGFEVSETDSLRPLNSHGYVEPVEIPIRHMAVTGQTQESGKTTTLEALITRSGLPAIAFLTKRGEASMNGRQILPYFQDRADWQFVQSILESTMRERMKFERAWIVRACKGAHSLADVLHRVTRLQEGAKSSLSQDVYMLLGEYLQKVVPLIASLPKIDRVDLCPGLSIMDLVRYPLELQMLVISSTLDWIHKNAAGVISIIPEAWKFVPQGKNAPVKVVAENLIREGAGLKNYLWIDSQDMAAVDKLLLRACPVWLIGVQREANEIKRALANMPAMLKKPKASDVAMLGLGQFFACYGREIRKTYVQPAWMDETAARQIAAGRLDVHQAASLHTSAKKDEEDDMEWKVKFEESERHRAQLTLALQQLREQYWALRDGKAPLPPVELAEHTQPTRGPARTGTVAGEIPLRASANGPEPSVLSDALYSQILTRLLQDAPTNPQVLQLLASRPEIIVRVQKQSVDLDGTTLRGRLAVLIAENFFDRIANGNAAWQELNKRGIGSAKPNVYRELDKLTEMGFLLKVDGGFQTAPGMKVSKKTIEAAA